MGLLAYRTYSEEAPIPGRGLADRWTLRVGDDAVLRTARTLAYRAQRQSALAVFLPVVSYYEIGTALTTNHGHAAMMGVYGMLAIGLGLFCMRYMIPEKR